MGHPLLSGPSLAPEICRLDGSPGLDWVRTMEEAPNPHLAGAAEWHSIIRTAYGHRPVYLMARDGSGESAILPAFHIRHRLLGSVLTSMPFLDGGGPFGSSAHLARTLVSRLQTEAEALGAGRIEIRSLAPLEVAVEPSLAKVTLVLPLPGDPVRLWRQLDAKVRNQVRKAERSGLSVAAGGLELLEDFYRVFAVNMRDLGSPVHAKGFFRAILEAFGPAARILLVRGEGAILGGLVLLAFRETAYVPWASCLRQYAPQCPNMLLYWEALSRASGEGFARFDFGRSTRGSGTYRFKRQWGAHEEPLYWYSIPLRGRQSPPGPGPAGAWILMSRMWRRLPIGMSRVLGPRIRKYLTQ